MENYNKKNEILKYYTMTDLNVVQNKHYAKKILKFIC